MLLHPRNRLVCVLLCEFGGISRSLHDLIIAQQRHAPLFLEVNRLHRIEVMQQAEVVIESLILRQEWLMKTEMPFADAGRRIAVLVEQFR